VSPSLFASVRGGLPGRMAERHVGMIKAHREESEPKRPSKHERKEEAAEGASGAKAFVIKHYRHFNAGAVADAAADYEAHIEKGGLMLVSLAGAMSTAELGISLAEMIRRKKVHAISCTGANLEEDIFNLVAHEHYERLSDYRDLTPKDEKALMDRHINRVTDVGIPEKAAMTPIEHEIERVWRDADKAGEARFPHEFLWDILRDGALSKHYQTDPKNSWVLAAMEMNAPIFVPGWEDSTLGNVYTSSCMAKRIKNVHTVKGGVEYMMALCDWYRHASKKPTGFFQIGGGIAGDFSICVVPLLRQDATPKEMVPLWGYFCQIGDSTTSYGSYSGAVPNEKITWGKLDVDTPRHMIESDASIVAPLIFSYVLGW
jgi:deoxyhypusine synthase